MVRHSLGLHRIVALGNTVCMVSRGTYQKKLKSLSLKVDIKNTLTINGNLWNEYIKYIPKFVIIYEYSI